MTFTSMSIFDFASATDENLDAMPFGVIGFGPDGIVTKYSATESRLAGLSPERVLGKHVFTAVAPCMNNALVAERFAHEPEIDATIDYVLTLRMRPTPVKLRMLKSAGTDARFIMIQR